MSFERIADKVRAGQRLDEDDALALFHEKDVLKLGALANLVRERRHGDRTYFNKNMRVEVTNVCVASCLFCSFAKLEEGMPGAHTMRLEEAWKQLEDRLGDPPTEVHVVNGLHPGLPFSYYEDLLRGFKRILPTIHLKCFTGVEIHFFAQHYGMTYEVVLEKLRAAGLDSLPGGGADIMARTIQGISGAGLQPVTQAVLLSINPKERHTRVLAYQSMSSMLGPLFAPTLGGYLTDTLTWRWVFFINLPVGLLAFLGLLTFLPRDRNIEPIRFDLFGFSVLALAVASLQLFLDRGEQLDWFDSPEIVMWAVACCLGIYFTVVHTLTARKSFVPKGLFGDWNFMVASFLGTCISIASFGSQPLITFMMQQLMGYSALRSGSLVAMASLSSMIGVVVIATPLRRLGDRMIIAIGLLLLGWSQVLYSSLSLYADQWPILIAGIVKGAGVGLTMTMLPGITFSTLPAHLRNEGAAFSALVRNMGMSVGVTGTQIMAIHETGVVRARLVEGVRDDNPLLHYAFPGFDLNSLPSIAGIGGEIARQSVMVGYVDAFLAAGIMAFVLIPTVMLIRMRR